MFSLFHFDLIATIFTGTNSFSLNFYSRNLVQVHRSNFCQYRSSPMRELWRVPPVTFISTKSIFQGPIRSEFCQEYWIPPWVLADYQWSNVAIFVFSIHWIKSLELVTNSKRKPQENCDNIKELERQRDRGEEAEWRRETFSSNPKDVLGGRDNQREVQNVLPCYSSSLSTLVLCRRLTTRASTVGSGSLWYEIKWPGTTTEPLPGASQCSLGRKEGTTPGGLELGKDSFRLDGPVCVVKPFLPTCAISRDF